MMTRFRAIELDPTSKKRTGRQHELQAQTRQAAVDELIELLGVPRETAHIDPTRTLVQIDSELWTLVGRQGEDAVGESPSLRRGGAKHKHVR